MFSLHEKYQLDDGDVSVPFLLVVLSSLFNVNWYQLPPGGSYLKASSPKGLKAWSWQELGVGGRLLNKAQLFLLQLSTFHQWTSYSVSCCQGSLTIAVAILRATSKTPYTPTIFFRDHWLVRNSRNPSIPKQGALHNLIMSLLLVEWLSNVQTGCSHKSQRGPGCQVGEL